MTACPRAVLAGYNVYRCEQSGIYGAQLNVALLTSTTFTDRPWSREHVCKIIIGHRLKQSGMRWTVRGANAIITLRCSELSGRWEEFWEARSTG